MTKAKLTVWIDWDSDRTGAGMNVVGGPNAVEIDIEVNEGDKPITIEITDSLFSVNTPYEPRFVITEER